MHTRQNGVQFIEVVSSKSTSFDSTAEIIYCMNMAVRILYLSAHTEWPESRTPGLDNDGYSMFITRQRRCCRPLFFCSRELFVLS